MSARTIEVARDFGEKRFLGRGSERGFLLGKVNDLTTKDRSTLRARTPSQLVEDVLLPAFNTRDIPEIFRSRCAEIAVKWANNDPQRRSVLYETIAAFPPLSADTSGLETEQDFHDLNRLVDVDILFGYMFPSIIEHFNHLGPRAGAIFKEPYEIESKSDTNLAVARRIIMAINSRLEEDVKKYSTAEEYDPNTRQRYMSTLLPFVNPETSIPFRIQEEVAEVIVRLTPEKETILPHVLWLTLSSHSDDVIERVMDDISIMFEADNAQATAIFAEQVKETPADYEHREIWYQWTEIVNGMETPPGDELFRALTSRLMLSATSEYALSYPSSLGPICGALDTILNHPLNANRKTELIRELDAYIVLESLLELYLKTEINANTWIDRAQMLNLAGSLGQIVKDRLAAGTLRNLISIVYSQPDDAFAPQWITSQESGGQATRITEKEAADKLYALTSPAQGK